MAPFLVQETQLVPGFHSFGHNPQIKIPGHRDDRRYDRSVVGIVGDIDNKGPIGPPVYETLRDTRKRPY